MDAHARTGAVKCSVHSKSRVAPSCMNTSLQSFQSSSCRPFVFTHYCRRSRPNLPSAFHAPCALKQTEEPHWKPLLACSLSIIMCKHAQVVVSSATAAHSSQHASQTLHTCPSHAHAPIIAPRSRSTECITIRSVLRILDRG